MSALPPEADIVLHALKLRLDRLEQLEAHRTVVAPERDDEAHRPVLGAAGIARKRADAFERAGLIRAAFAALEQAGVGREQVEHLGKPARRKAVATAKP